MKKFEMKKLLHSSFAILHSLLLSACCASLPKLPEKRAPFPSFAPELSTIDEALETFRDERRKRDVPVKIYAPANANRKLPVVVFSHGIGEDRESYAWLGRAIARHGFLVVHITHAGTDRAMLERGYRHLYRAVKEPRNWIDRPLDVSFVLDRLASRNDADLNRVAAVGHSAGAFTSLALAGMRMTGGTLKDARVKVAIPMSMPRMDGVVPPGGYDAIGIPVLNVTGTCDIGIIWRTWPKHRRIPFEQTHAANQYLVTLDGANHDSFVIEDRHRDAIVSLTIAFLRAHLRGDDKARTWFGEPGRGEIAGVGFFVERKNESAR